MTVRQLKTNDEIAVLAARAATHSSEGRKLDKVAKAIARRIKAKALDHKQSGKLYRSVKPGRKVTEKNAILDRVVWLDRNAIAHLEFGHFMGSVENGDDRRWVDGIHIIRRSVRGVARDFGTGTWTPDNRGGFE